MQLRKLAVAIATLVLAPLSHATSLNLAHMNSETHAVHLGAQQLQQAVNSRSEGRVTINLFPSGQLGSNAQVAELITMGSPIVGHFGTPNVGDFLPDYHVTTYPFLFQDFDEAMVFMGSDLVKSMEEQVEKENNLKVMCYFAFGVRDVYSRNTPIRSPEDMRNMKIREQPVTLYVELARQSFTAVPTPMPWTDVYNALSYGIIDAAEAPPSAMLDQKHYEHIKYYSTTNHIHDISTFSMPATVYSSLTKADQKILNEEFEKTCNWITESVKNSYAAELDELREAGVEIITDVDRAAFEKNSQEIYKAFPEWREGLYKEAQQIVAEIRG
ncbi:TRAP transporter substrate-binding protein DctP [Vibrio astriarenae]